MAVNRDKPDRWKADVAQSVDMYNTWFNGDGLHKLEPKELANAMIDIAL